MKREHKLLLLIFLIVLSFRLFFVFQTANFSSDDAYFNIRHTKYINLYLTPLIHDDLSYGGRTIINSQVYHYFLSFFNAFDTTFAFKILPEILLALLVIAVYLIADSITKNPLAALISAFLSGFVPISITQTLNQVSIYSVILPLFFYQFYCMLNLETKISQFIIGSILLPLIHPIGFIFSIMMIVYILLLELDYTSPEPLAKEAVLFSAMIGLLANLIIYKKVFLSSGLYAVWQNIPQELLSTYFKNINVLDIMLNIGIVTLIFGVLGLLFGIYRQRNRIVYLLSAMIITDFTMLFSRMINFQVGIMFLGLLLAITASIGFDRFIKYIEFTKFSKAKPYLVTLLILFVLLTAVLPTYFAANKLIKNTLSQQEINALAWVRDNTLDDKTVLGNIDEGNYITYFAKRKNVIDSQFLLAPNRYSDVNEAFTTESLVKALQILGKYKVDYIYLSERANNAYSNKAMKYINNECFRELYSNEHAKVYKVAC